MLLQEYLKKMKELQAKVNSMEKQLSDKDDAEQNNELAKFAWMNHSWLIVPI